MTDDGRLVTGRRVARAAAGTAAALAVGLAHGAGESLAIPGPAEEGFGVCVASIGDLDGDGAVDLAIGANGGVAGSVTLVSGATGETIRRIDGTDAGQNFGTFIAPAGDFDGDGTPDLLVSAPGTSDYRRPPGYVIVASGADGSTIVRADGSVAAGFFGRVACVVGDVTGDDVPDLLVGQPRSNPGQVLGFSGADGTPIPWMTKTGEPGADLGTGVAAVGDVNRDGVPDFAASAPWGASGGRVFLWSGKNGRLLRTIAAPKSDFLGTALAAADFDGDGLTDLAVTGDGRNGFVRLHSLAKKAPAEFPAPAGATSFGRFLSVLPDLDGRPGAELAAGSYGTATVISFGAASPVQIARVDGPPGSSFGQTLAGAPDVGGPEGAGPDGIPDLAVGAFDQATVFVHPLPVTRVVLLPKKLSLRAAFVRSAGSPPAARGRMSLDIAGGRAKYSLSWQGLAAAEHGVFLEDAPGSHTWTQLGTVTGAKGAFSLSGSKALPPALGTADAEALGGRVVELRDGTGAPVLSALFPYAGDTRTLSARIPLSPVEGSGLSGALNVSFDPRTGAQKASLKVKGAPKSGAFELWTGGTGGAGETSKLSGATGGKFAADTVTGFWPFGPRVRAVDILRVLAQLKDGSGSPVAQGVYTRPSAPRPDLRVRKIRLDYQAFQDELLVRADIENAGGADAGEVNVRADLVDMTPPVGPGGVANERGDVRTTDEFPAGVEVKRIAIASFPTPTLGGPPLRLTVFVEVDTPPAPQSYGEYLESDESNIWFLNFVWNAAENDYEAEGTTAQFLPAFGDPR